MSPIFYVPQIEGELTPTTLNKPWVQGQTSSCLFFCLIVDARRHWIYFYCVLHVVPNPASHKVPIYQRPKLWSTWFFETRCWQESLLHFSTPALSKTTTHPGRDVKKASKMTPGMPDFLLIRCYDPGESESLSLHLTLYLLEMQRHRPLILTWCLCNAGQIKGNHRDGRLHAQFTWCIRMPLFVASKLAEKVKHHQREKLNSPVLIERT